MMQVESLVVAVLAVCSIENCLVNAATANDALSSPFDGFFIDPTGNSTARLEDAMLTSSPTMASILPEISCYSDLTLLAADMFARIGGDEEPQTYVVCSNSVHEVGQLLFQDDTPFLCESGESPLIPRSHTKILCGEDGRSENNCVLRSGPFQVVSVFASYWEQLTAAEISGFTFEDSEIGAVLLGNGGDITFRDCVFRNHTRTKGTIISHFNQNYGESGKRFLFIDELARFGLYDGQIRTEHQQDVVQAAGLRGLEQQRLAGETEETGAGVLVDHRHREVNWKRQRSRFENCLFEKNAQSLHTNDTTIFGVITIELMYDDVEIINSTFTENDFGSPVDAIGYAVSVSQGSTLTLSDNCFINNNFIGDGIILLQNETDLRNVSNNFVTPDNALHCQFIAIKSNSTNATCIDADGQECAYD